MPPVSSVGEETNIYRVPKKGGIKAIMLASVVRHVEAIGCTVGTQKRFI